MPARHIRSVSARYPVSRYTASAGISSSPPDPPVPPDPPDPSDPPRPPSPDPTITMDVGRISLTHQPNRTAMDPSLMRFSMSGRTQYLIVDFNCGARCTIVTYAPARNISSADSAAELPPPTITTRCR